MPPMLLVLLAPCASTAQSDARVRNAVVAALGAVLRGDATSMRAEVETDASDALAAAICHLNTRRFQKTVEESAGGGRR